MELTAQKGKGDRGKRTRDRALTRDLRSIAELQPREPRRPAEILCPPSLLCTGHRCAAIQQHLRPASQAGTVCYVMVAGSVMPSRLHDRYIRAMGDEGSQLVSVACMVEAQ